MKTTDIKLKPSLLALFVVSTLLSGCGDDDEVVVTPEPTPPAVVMQTYTVTVTNLTANQPMSPVIVASHSADAMLWQAGETASLAIEKMAEGGDTADIAALEAVTNSVNGAGMLMPGMTETLTLTLAEADVANLSLVTMLVNTNDAFTGVNGVNIAEMDVNVPGVNGDNAKNIAGVDGTDDLADLSDDEGYKGQYNIPVLDDNPSADPNQQE